VKGGVEGSGVRASKTAARAMGTSSGGMAGGASLRGPSVARSATTRGHQLACLQRLSSGRGHRVSGVRSRDG